MSEPKVVVYFQPGWHFCDLERAWLSEHGVEYEERNVVEDPDAMEELEELGYFSTPVTLINEDVVVGFDKKKLIDLLGLDWSMLA